MIQKKGDPTIRLEQYKWASLDCLFIFPIVMSLLIIPLAYKKSAWTFFREYWLGNLPKGFTWDTYIPMVIAILLLFLGSYLDNSIYYRKNTNQC